MRKEAITTIHGPAMAASARTDAPALAAGLITVTLWGSAFVVIRAAGKVMSPSALALGRLLVSSALLTAAVLGRREPLPSRRDLAGIGAYGILFLAIYSVALNAAERRVDAATAAMLISTGPLLIVLLAGVFLREGSPRWLFAGGAIAFAGSAAIGLATSQAGPRAVLGIALLLVAVVAYAIAVIVRKSVLARVSALQLTWLGCVAATVALLPFAPVLVRDVMAVGTPAIGWIVYLGAGPTTIGFLTWAFALRRTSAGRMRTLVYLVSPVAMLLGWAILGEAPPWPAMAGGALCLAGVWLAGQG